jgi:arginine decarboxylase
MDTPLLDAMQAYRRLNRRRFHVPGHGGTHQGARWVEQLGLDLGVVAYDLTELEGLDALAHPEAVIHTSQQQAARVFGAQQTWYCVNGASVALQASMMSAFRPGDLVIVPRNAHRAVISGLVLCGAMPVWVLPEWDEAWAVWGKVPIAALEEAYRHHPTAKGVLLTHPSYEGIPSDVVAIASWCRDRALRLIVDEAHGCLWPLMPQAFPPSAVGVLGVDAVVHSLHKTGGSLTQTALLHQPVGSQLEPATVQEALNHLHTTSPSYVLMASIEGAIAGLASPQGQALLAQTVLSSLELKQAIAALTHWRVANHTDPMRCLIRHANALPEDWATALEGLPPGQAVAYEAMGSHSVLYLRQLGLEASDDLALLAGLSGWGSDHLTTLPNPEAWKAVAEPLFALPKQCLPPRDAFFALGQTVLSSQALGRIALQTVVRCPPGIPVVVPGERIERHHLPHLPSVIRVMQD